jgi:hypothetical protein
MIISINASILNYSIFITYITKITRDHHNTSGHEQVAQPHVALAHGLDATCIDHFAPGGNQLAALSYHPWAKKCPGNSKPQGKFAVSVDQKENTGRIADLKKAKNRVS